MSRCVVEPGLEFESSLFARELLEELRLGVPARRTRPSVEPRRVSRIELPKPTIIVLPEIIDEQYERWDGMG